MKRPRVGVVVAGVVKVQAAVEAVDGAGAYACIQPLAGALGARASGALASDVLSWKGAGDGEMLGIGDWDTGDWGNDSKARQRAQEPRSRAVVS